MGIVIETLLFCDGIGCPMDGPYGEGDARAERGAQLRRQAKNSGWTRRNGKDFCPDCSAKMRKQPNAPLEGRD